MNEFSIYTNTPFLKVFVNGYSHTAFRNLKYKVWSMLIPKFSGPGYYVFMSINFDIGLLKSIAPCNYSAALWYLWYILGGTWGSWEVHACSVRAHASPHGTDSSGRVFVPLCRVCKLFSSQIPVPFCLFHFQKHQERAFSRTSSLGSPGLDKSLLNLKI